MTRRSTEANVPFPFGTFVNSVYCLTVDPKIRTKYLQCLSFSSLSSLSKGVWRREQTNSCNIRSGWPRGKCSQGSISRGCIGPQNRWVSQSIEAVRATATWVAMETAEPLHWDPREQDPWDWVISSRLKSSAQGSVSQVIEKIEKPWHVLVSLRTINKVYTSLNAVFFFFEASPFWRVVVTVKH